MLLELRRPTGGQLLLLSLIPTLLLYHTYIRETTLSTGEVVFSILAFCLMVVSIVVEGFLESPAYLLLFGGLVTVFSTIQFTRNGDLLSLVLSLGGLLLVVGTLSRLRRGQPRSY